MGDKTKPHMKIIRGYLDPIVDEALKKKQKGEEKADEEEKSTLLEHLVASTEGVYNVSYPMTKMILTTGDTDRTVIRDELLNILLAGRDTVRLVTKFAH